MSVLLKEHSECCLKEYFDKLMDIRGTEEQFCIIYLLPWPTQHPFSCLLTLHAVFSLGDYLPHF